MLVAQNPLAVRATAAPAADHDPSSGSRPLFLAEMKDRQGRKIRQLKDALAAEGVVALDQQAQVLGLSRSTTWTLLRGSHKASGLSAAVIQQILRQPQLPSLVRLKVLEYIEDKAAGAYGHSPACRRRFLLRLAGARMIDEPSRLLVPDVVTHA